MSVKFAAVIGLLLVAPNVCLAADPYERLSRKLAGAAEDAGYRRVAVLPFQPAAGDDQRGGLALSERLVSRLAAEKGIQVVERTLLDRVLGEQGLGYQGLIDPRNATQVGKILGVDAIVTGTFIKLSRARFELHTRLIDTETARILGAATARVEREWEEDWSPSDNAYDVRPPNLDGIRAPVVHLLPDFSPSSGGGVAHAALGSCERWEELARAREASVLDIKARHWASRLREPGFSTRKLSRNPGSEIRSLDQRQEFYRRVKELHRSGYNIGITLRERERLEAADRFVESLAEACY